MPALSLLVLSVVSDVVEADVTRIKETAKKAAVEAKELTALAKTLDALNDKERKGLSSKGDDYGDDDEGTGKADGAPLTPTESNDRRVKLEALVSRSEELQRVINGAREEAAQMRQWLEAEIREKQGGHGARKAADGILGGKINQFGGLVDKVDPAVRKANQYRDWFGALGKDFDALGAALNQMHATGNTVQTTRYAVEGEDRRTKQAQQRAAAAAEAAAKKARSEARLLEPAGTGTLFAARAIANSKPAHELFAAAHPSRFVFSLKRMPKDSSGAWLDREIQRGEALLASDNGLVSVDGMLFRGSEADFTGAPLKGITPLALKREWLTVYGDDRKPLGGSWVAAPDATGFSLEDNPAWMKLFPAGDDRLAAFTDERDKMVECYNRETARLDPENKRGKYEVITYDTRTWSEKKVESLEAVIDRKSCAKCKCEAFNKRKSKLALDVLKAEQEKRLLVLKPAMERVNAELKKKK